MAATAKGEVTDDEAGSPGPAEVARMLSEIAALLELKGGERYRARAFARASRELEGINADLGQLTREKRLTSLRGIGEGIAAVVSEYVLTGSAGMYDRLTADTPVALHELMRVPGLGSKRILQLRRDLGIGSLDDLEAAAIAGQIATVPGFGERSESSILEGIAFARSVRQRRRYPDAWATALAVLDTLRAHPAVNRALVAGQIRRKRELIDEVSIIAETDDPAGVLGSRVFGIAEPGDSAESDEVVGMLPDGLQLRIRVVPTTDFAGALLWTTGSSAHLEEIDRAADRKGLRLDRSGLKQPDGERVRVASEAALYEMLGLQFIEPELREGSGEVVLSAENRLPDLVSLDDLRGTFHCHTTYSDGKATLEEMAAAAIERGWDYLGVADHSQSAGYAGGLTPAAVREQWRRIEKLNRAMAAGGGRRFQIFKGIESDILRDGSLDYKAPLLAGFDYVIGSVHSAFAMESAAMTKRVVRALGNRHLTMLGHPTGRLLLRREGYDLDIGAVIEAAAENRVIIEINSNPNRLDLDWRHVRTAVAAGVVISINPDAHSVRAIGNVEYGVYMARKAGLEPDQVFNTWPLEKVRDYFAARKQGR